MQNHTDIRGLYGQPTYLPFPEHIPDGFREAVQRVVDRHGARLEQLSYSAFNGQNEHGTLFVDIRRSDGRWCEPRFSFPRADLQYSYVWKAIAAKIDEALDYGGNKSHRQNRRPKH